MNFTYFLIEYFPIKGELLWTRKCRKRIWRPGIQNPLSCHHRIACMRRLSFWIEKEIKSFGQNIFIAFFPLRLHKWMASNENFLPKLSHTCTNWRVQRARTTLCNSSCSSIVQRIVQQTLTTRFHIASKLWVTNQFEAQSWKHSRIGWFKLIKIPN